MGLRSPLGDITNDCTPSTQKPKAGTWKKKARAKGQGSSDLRIFTVPEKRTSEVVFQLEDGDLKCLKNAWVTENDLISVEAGVQPRRVQ